MDVVGKIEFNFETESDFRAALDGSKWKSLVLSFDEQLRSKIKYDDMPEEKRGGLQEARDIIHELLNDYNLDLWGDD